MTGVIGEQDGAIFSSVIVRIKEIVADLGTAPPPSVSSSVAVISIVYEPTSAFTVPDNVKTPVVGLTAIVPGSAPAVGARS